MTWRATPTWGPLWLAHMKTPSLRFRPKTQGDDWWVGVGDGDGGDDDGDDDDKLSTLPCCFLPLIYVYIYISSPLANLFFLRFISFVLFLSLPFVCFPVFLS